MFVKVESMERWRELHVVLTATEEMKLNNPQNPTIHTLVVPTTETQLQKNTNNTPIHHTPPTTPTTLTLHDFMVRTIHTNTQHAAATNLGSYVTYTPMCLTRYQPPTLRDFMVRTMAASMAYRLSLSTSSITCGKGCGWI